MIFTRIRKSFSNLNFDDERLERGDTVAFITKTDSMQDELEQFTSDLGDTVEDLNSLVDELEEFALLQGGITDISSLSADLTYPEVPFIQSDPYDISTRSYPHVLSRMQADGLGDGSLAAYLTPRGIKYLFVLKEGDIVVCLTDNSVPEYMGGDALGVGDVSTGFKWRQIPDIGPDIFWLCTAPGALDQYISENYTTPATINAGDGVVEVGVGNAAARADASSSLKIWMNLDDNGDVDGIYANSGSGLVLAMGVASSDSSDVLGSDENYVAPDSSDISTIDFAGILATKGSYSDTSSAETSGLVSGDTYWHTTNNTIETI